MRSILDRSLFQYEYSSSPPPHLITGVACVAVTAVAAVTVLYLSAPSRSIAYADPAGQTAAAAEAGVIDRVADRTFRLLCPIFGSCPKESEAAVAQEPTAPTRPQQGIAKASSAASAATTTVIQQTIQPIRERVVEHVVERAPIVASGGISDSEFTERLDTFRQDILRLVSSQASQQSAQTSAVYSVVAQSQRIDNLSNTTIQNPTITGGTISGASITGDISAAAGSFSGGITAATSTFARLRLSGTDCSGFGGGGKLTTDAFGFVVCADDGGGGGASASGTTTEIQFNAGGDFAASPSLTFDPILLKLSTPNASTTNLSAAQASVGTLSLGSALSPQYGGTGSTTLSGVLKGNGVSGIATAVAGADYELPLVFGEGLTRNSNAITLDTSINWAGTFAGFTAPQLLAAGFSTTSADFWKSSRSFFATSSADTWLAARTTDAVSEGSTNRYYTNDRVVSLLQAGSGINLTYDHAGSLTISSFGGGEGGTDVNWAYASNGLLRPATSSNTVLVGMTSTTSGARFQVAGGASFDTATTTNLAVSGVTSSLLKTDASGRVVSATAGTDYVANAAGTWSGTLGGYSASQLLSSAFSTTSAAYWDSLQNRWATSSAQFFLSQNQGVAFSTTSANNLLATYDKGFFFSTTSADVWKGIRDFFSTSSVAYWESLQTRWATSSSDSWLGLRSTSNLTEGSNLYYTDARTDARINATTTIGTLASAPNLGTVSTSLTGVLKATAGVLSTALVDLASNVTGILSIAHGGTGWANLASGTVLLGNGTGAISTTTRGSLTETGSSVLTISGGSNALLGSGATIQVAQASGSQAGFLSASDWTTFNGKQAALGFTPAQSTRLFNTNYPLLGGGDLTGNRTLSLAFGTTTDNTWGGTQTFANQASFLNGAGITGNLNLAGSAVIKDTDSKLLLTTSGGANIIESGNADFSAGAPFYITGRYMQDAPLIQLSAATTSVSGVLTAKKLHIIPEHGSTPGLLIQQAGPSQGLSDIAVNYNDVQISDFTGQPATGLDVQYGVNGTSWGRYKAGFNVHAYIGGNPDSYPGDITNISAMTASTEGIPNVTPSYNIDLFGLNPGVSARGTGYATLVGAEYDIGIEDTGSAKSRVGIQVISTGPKGGTLNYDSAYVVGVGQGLARWNYGWYWIHDSFSSTTGAILGGANTDAHYGIDFSNVTFASDAFRSPGFVITKSGSVGIGTTNPGSLLTVNGTAAKPGGGSWSDSSDERLKTTVAPIAGADALGKLLQLKPVTFDWKNPSLHGNATSSGGFLAQDVAQVFPDFVATTSCQDADCALVGGATSSPAYSLTLPFKFFGYLVAAIQEVAKEVAGFADHFTTRELTFTRAVSTGLGISPLWGAQNSPLWRGW